MILNQLNFELFNQIRLILFELLTSASPTEAKYISTIVVEELRVGIGEGTLKDSISKLLM